MNTYLHILLYLLCAQLYVLLIVNAIAKPEPVYFGDPPDMDFVACDAGAEG